MKTNALPVLLLVAATFGFSGCATTQPPPPPPVVLNLIGTHPAADVILHTVIIPGGPNAWSPNAQWDEYVLTITNRSPASLTIEAATIDDILNHPQGLGSDPRKLARSTEANWKTYCRSKVPVSPNKLSPPSRSHEPTWWSTLLSPPVVLPYTLPLQLSIEQSYFGKLRKGIAERQLVFPLNLQPGTSAMGSVFFPITPGPRRFVLQGRSDGKPVEIVIPLTGLSALHLATAPSSFPTTAATPKRHEQP